MRRPLPQTVATFECTCSIIHVAQDGKIPVGWTKRQGQVWCADCTLAGVPTRQLIHGVSRKRRRAA